MYLSWFEVIRQSLGRLEEADLARLVGCLALS